MMWYFRFKSTDDLTRERVNKNFSSQGFENVLGLFDLILSLPPTSVNNESILCNEIYKREKERKDEHIYFEQLPAHKQASS